MVVASSLTCCSSAAAAIIEEAITTHHGCSLLVLIKAYWRRVDLHTQENDGSKNSEEAEKLIEAAQTLFSENREPSCRTL